MTTTPAPTPTGPDGFTLVEVLVALALVSLSLLGCARLMLAGIELEDRARRLQRADEAIEQASLEGSGLGAWHDLGDSDGRGLGCRVRSVPASAGIDWAWVEASCGDARLSDGARAVARMRLVPR